MAIWQVETIKLLSMKKCFASAIILFIGLTVLAQPDPSKYPQPEFSNEVYLYNKDSMKLSRLEKDVSKMETKTKLAGMGGAENGYSIEGEKSPIRLANGNGLLFIYSTGAASRSDPVNDSVLRANGIDPSQMQSYGSAMDPANMITLYKAESGKGKRKMLLMKSPGAMPFGSKKLKSSDKMSFSVRKVREGYWELILDKPLSKGEYAFVVQGSGMGSMDGGVTVFAFAVE
jgi:hypothetical protein